jgi:probable ribonuclease
VTVDATESAHGSVVASASVADAKAPVESEAPTLFGIGVSAADIKRVGKED